MNEEQAKEAFETALSSYKQEFGTFFLARLYGLEITYEENACIVQFEVKEYMFNPQGSLHGGVMATVMDISMGHLLKHVSGPGVTLEMKLQYLRPVTQGRIRVRGQFIKRGKEICFLSSEASDSRGKLVAIATSTWKPL